MNLKEGNGKGCREKREGGKNQHIYILTSKNKNNF